MKYIDREKARKVTEELSKKYDKALRELAKR